MNYVFLRLAAENPEARTECLKWINKNVESIPDCDTAATISPLVSCLQDKKKEIRSSAEDILGIIMPIVGYAKVQAETKNLKPAVQQTVKPILERIKNSCGAQGAG